jgi:large subunit ribosomal protein L21
MYAIVDIAGQQFKVEKDQKLFVHRLAGDEGKQVSFEKVMLLDTGSKVLVGDPVVKGASVSAKIIAHVKGDKVLVFKKKRRKGYQKLNGHRQQMTQIQIEEIAEKSAAKPKQAEESAKAPATGKEKTAATKPSSAKAEAPKSGAKKDGAKAATGAAKKSAPKKAAATQKKSAPSAKGASAKASSASRSTSAGKPAADKKSGEEKASE